MKIEPVVVVNPWLALALTFWKPLLVAFVVFAVLFTLVLLPAARMMAREAANASVVPTMAIPETWRASLTQAAVTPAPHP
jgi:hypothetical protein